MEFADASGFAHSTFYTFTPRFEYLRAWWGWWLKSKGAMVRIAKPPGRMRPRHSVTFDRFLAAGSRAPVVTLKPSASGLNYIADQRRFPALDVGAILLRYPVTTWRVSGDVLFAFVGSMPVGLVVSIWTGDGPMPRRQRAKVAP